MPLDAPPILLTDTLDDPEGRIQVDDGRRRGGSDRGRRRGPWPTRPDRERRPANVMVVAGLGGVGIMLAPVLGRIAAEWIVQGHPTVVQDAERLLPGRVIA